MFLGAAHDIFGFARGRSWSDFKKNISGEQIRQLYMVKARLWPPSTDWAALMPEPGGGKLSALYLGARPELTLKNILRFSLYSDRIFVIDPFTNPYFLKPEYNPIENPNRFKRDTIKLVHFLFSVAPWIQSKMLYLIPDPGELDIGFKWETIELAKARRGDSEVDPRDLEEARAESQESLRRVLSALPDERLLRQAKRTGLMLTPEQEQHLLAYARYELENDPIALEQSLIGKDKWFLDAEAPILRLPC